MKAWVPAGVELEHYLVSLLIFAALLLASLAGLRFVMQRARQARPESLWGSLGGPLSLLLLVISGAIAVEVGPQELRQLPAFIYGSKIGLILAVLWLADRVYSTLIKRPGFMGIESDASRSLILKGSRFLAFALALLIILDTVGVSITPLIASLGVSSLAVALALQDTLSNFFSGIYILVDRPFRLGDYIRTADNFEGFVRHIGWRSTHIQSSRNFTVVIPNSKLSSTVVSNFDLPTSETVITVEIEVPLSASLAKAEELALECARETQKKDPDAVPDYEPKVRFTAFKELRSVEMVVDLKIRHFSDARRVRHDFIRRLERSWRAAGILFHA